MSHPNWSSLLCPVYNRVAQDWRVHGLSIFNYFLGWTWFDFLAFLSYSSSFSLDSIACSRFIHVLSMLPSSHISINSWRLYFLRKNRNIPHFSLDSQKHRYGASSVMSWLYLICLNGGLDFLKSELKIEFSSLAIIGYVYSFILSFFFLN